MSDATRTKRSGGRAGRQNLRTSHEPERDAFITRLIKPYELVSDEGLELIEHNADTVLEVLKFAITHRRLSDSKMRVLMLTVRECVFREGCVAK